MYRIKFCTKRGQWLIQIITWGFFWSTVCEKGKVATFATLDAANENVKALGIDKVYRNYRKSAVAYAMSGGYPNPPGKPLGPPNTWLSNSMGA